MARDLHPKFSRRTMMVSGLSLACLPRIAHANNDFEFEDFGELVRVIDGDSFVLSSGLKVRLANIFAPQKSEPFYEEARSALKNLLSGRQIGLHYAGPKRDRFERAVAQVYTLRPDGRPDQWIQNEMIRAGFARVRSYSESAFQISELMAEEVIARDAGRGLWQSERFSVRSPAPNILAQDVDSFQLVEGLIISSAQIKGQTYLNFGSDYLTDFTVSIARRNRRRFEKAGVDLSDLEGARVRVRGWVELFNGPVIWIDHPEALEFLNSRLI